MKNNLKKLNPQFRKILKFSAQTAKEFDYRVYLVGGAVRDLLLQRPVLDLDITVEGDAIFLVKKLSKKLSKKFRCYHAFGTATLYYGDHKIDFATAREEKYSHPGALPKVKKASLKEDLWRRDFTINALAVSINRKRYGDLWDFYGGLTDLKKGLIKVLHSESFRDDSLRILRAVRFEQRFSFKIEKKTYALMKHAIREGALGWVNPHRLRDELVLLLKEPRPYRCIKRLYQFEKFNFINKSLFLNKEDFFFFKRVQSTVVWYDQKIKQANIKTWLIYLAGLLIKLSKNERAKFFSKFGFKKEERAIIESIKKNLANIKQLNRKEKPSQIHKKLNNYSLEAILFFYAYFTDRNLRKNIRFFLTKISCLKPKITGKDLQRMEVGSSFFMGKVLQEVFYLKLDKGLKTKKEELKEAEKIIRKRKNICRG